MTSISSSVDYRGARGSNTGDQFHELWALQQVLELLRPETELKAIGVEGVRTDTPAQAADNPTWDGVDCALYYGGTSLETADRVEFAQLKYSSANPEKNWSVARLTENTAKKANNSVIRKMADDFKSAKLRMKSGAPLTIRLVSNQEVAEELKEALGTRWSGSLKKADIDQTIKDNLKRLITASGIVEKEFQSFLETLDLKECGYHSRFAVREKVVASVAELLGNDVSSEVRELQVRVRELMIPERSRETVTEKDLFLWFGLCGRDGLFPCAPDVRIPDKAVKRSAAEEAVSLLKKGERLVLVHGAGGCGKTTLMRQIADRLPDGSATIFFDCFGGGRYIHADDKRHLAENAFLQLTNELAVTLRLPLFIPRNTKYPANIKLLMQKLRSAGEALGHIIPNGMLLIIVDAADNAVAAANNANPPEKAFVHDLIDANLSDLPKNVHFIISCRTDPTRRASLRLPPDTPEVICPPFTLGETNQHLETIFPCLPDSFVEQFHHLSNQNPRVQAYAIASAKGDPAQLLDALRPGGKNLPDILSASFKTALKKLGQPDLFEKLIGSLAFLPAPVSVSSVARISGCSEDTVRDFVLELTPGLRLHQASITIADEDFEAFIASSASANRSAIISNIAEDFMAFFQTDPYCALHVADALINADRARDVLSIVERDPQVIAISDPILRRQVQVRRLKLSLAACREAGSAADALRTVLISAEAERDDSTLCEVLEKELDLSVEFAGPSLRRTILMDPDRIEEQGSFLAQDAVRAIRSGDRITAIEQLHFHDAWLNRRREIEKEKLNNWAVTDRDVSARVETILELAGPEAAFTELMRWSPRDVSLRVAFILVPQLIAADKIHHLRALLTECSPPSPWDLLLWVPLAMAGESVSGPAIQKSLKKLRRRFVPDVNAFGVSHSQEHWQKSLLDTFISACELAFKMALDSQIILSAVNQILLSLEGEQKRRLYLFDVSRIDGLFRCWLLREKLVERSAKVENFISYVHSLSPEPNEEKQGSGKKSKKSAQDQQRDDREIERLNKKMRALFPIYSERLEVLSRAREKQHIEKSQLNRLEKLASHAYDFDHDHDSSKLRVMAAQSIMGLLIVDSIKASELVEHANTLAKGRYSDLFASNLQKFLSLMRLRTTETVELVKLVAQTAESIKNLREASSDKLDALIRLSRLILPVSRDDAASVFNDAVSIAKEIDQEAIDQIDFVSVLAERARIPGQHNRKTVAGDIFAFVTGAAERLSGRDGFPWRSAIHALTSVDDAAALAALCRWADDGTVRLENTLDRYLLTALQRGIINPEMATSLALIIGGAAGDLRKDLVARAAENPLHYRGIIEELAKETLLFLPQHGRLNSGEEIVEKISTDISRDGDWLELLRKTVELLKQPNFNKSEESATDLQDNVLSLDNGRDYPKEFEFDPQGRSFTTPESIAEVLQEAETSGLRHHDGDLLRRMRDASSHIRDRVSFLSALANVPDDAIWESTRIDLLRDTLDAWKGTPAVDRWCIETLPSVLVTHFYGATRWLKEGDAALHKLLDHTGLDVEGRLRIFLAGVAKAGEALNSRALFAIAEEIARALDEGEAGEQLSWYTERLRNRLPAVDHALCILSDIPQDPMEAVARFLFALMSDIDTRVRWKSAHALRCMANLGCYDVVEATILQSSRVKDVAFRDPTAPFYFLAAKLWLAISLHRISSETPEALSACKDQIFDLATSSELPHVGIRRAAPVFLDTDLG